MIRGRRKRNGFRLSTEGRKPESTLSAILSFLGRPEKDGFLYPHMALSLQEHQVITPWLDDHCLIRGAQIPKHIRDVIQLDNVFLGPVEKEGCVKKVYPYFFKPIFFARVLIFS